MQRQIVGTLNVHFLDHFKKDILEHRNDPEYDILYLTAVPGSKHNFRVRIEDFHSVDLDNYDQWSQRFLTAFVHLNQPHPCGAPFIAPRWCKSVDQRNNTSALNTRAGNAYRITNQNAQCTGEAIPYSGDDEGCHTVLGNGSVGFQLLAVDADGQLAFYGEADCNGPEVDAFNPDTDETGTDCKPLQGNPLSFRFIKT